MVIFHCYVSSPEGRRWVGGLRYVVLNHSDHSHIIHYSPIFTIIAPLKERCLNIGNLKMVRKTSIKNYHFHLSGGLTVESNGPLWSNLWVLLLGATRSSVPAALAAAALPAMVRLLRRRKATLRRITRYHGRVVKCSSALWPCGSGNQAVVNVGQPW